MSWLSTAWRWIKRKAGKTDAEIFWSVVVSALTTEQRRDLTAKLRQVKFAVDLAAAGNDSDAVAEAQEWVDGALDGLQ